MGGEGSGWHGPKSAEWRAKNGAIKREWYAQNTEHITMPGAEKWRHLNTADSPCTVSPLVARDGPAPANVRIPVPAVRNLPTAVNPKILEFMVEMASFEDDPLGFVMWAFPWGKKGTKLEGMTGPEPWQRAQLERVGEAIRKGGAKGCVVEEDTTAGRGVGKSALVSWWILWSIATHADTRGVVTATTDTQLRTKTWAELSTWYQMFIGRAVFTLTATAIYIKDDPDREKTWRIDAIPGARTTSRRSTACTTRASG